MHLLIAVQVHCGELLAHSNLCRKQSHWIGRENLQGTRKPWVFTFKIFKFMGCLSNVQTSAAAIPKLGCLFHFWGEKLPAFPVFSYSYRKYLTMSDCFIRWMSIV